MVLHAGACGRVGHRRTIFPVKGSASADPFTAFGGIRDSQEKKSICYDPSVATEVKSVFRQWLQDHAELRSQNGLSRRCTVHPRSSSILDFASNDYLGMARDPRVLAGATEALHSYGVGSGASRLVTGTVGIHDAMERELAAFIGTESALLFSSGYLANLAAVSALGGPDALIVSDAGVHASLIDACRLSRSPVVVTPSGSLDAVRAALVQRSEPRALVVVDAVSSVDGSVAPLRSLHAVCQEHGAVLIADEAHALGVLGEGGRGLAHREGITGREDLVLTATLSKSLGSQGGVILCDSAVREHLINTARSFIFDTALSPACVGAALTAVRLLQTEPQLSQVAHARARDLAKVLGLRESPTSTVVSYILGDPSRAVAVTEACREEGLWVGCFRPPSVPEGTSRARFAVKATHSRADVERAAHIFHEKRLQCQ